MIGTKARRFTPVPAVSLDELVPADHFYRHVDRMLDLSFVRDLVQECYANCGRPSIDPVVFFKLQLVMFFEGVRSERHLLRLVADRLSVRWYLGYNLDEPLPDHSSLTRIRTRYGLPVFRRFFEAIVGQCQQAGLVWGQELYFDATHVLADAALDSLTARFAVEARAAMQAHVEGLFSAENLSSDTEHATASAESPSGHEHPDTVCLPAPTVLPRSLPEPLWQELDQAQVARQDWIAREGRPQREVHGRYLRTADVRISTTDPNATPLRLKGGGTHLGYQTHYVVDGGKRRIILGVLVTPGEVMENQPMLDLAWHVRFRWKLHPKQVTGDTTYGTVENIQALERMGVRAYVPLPDWEHKSSYYGTSHFVYDDTRDVYVCPQGQLLRPHHFEEPPPVIEYRADPGICPACPVKAACTPSPRWRAVHRHVAEEYLDRVRAYHQTKPYQKAIRKRQVWVEPLFAEGKQWHQMRRFRLRRLWRVNTEALLIAAGQNLKRLLQRRGWGHRPFPGGMAAGHDWSCCLNSFLCLLQVSGNNCRRCSLDLSAWMSNSPHNCCSLANNGHFFNTLEGFVEVYEKIVQLKMRASDGKMRATDAADTETLLRLIQSIPSPKAEPIKQWLAKVGAEKLEELAPVPLGTSIAQAWQEQPAPDADNLVWAEFLERMARLYGHQAKLDSRLRVVEATSQDHEEQLGELHSRMESNEALLKMVPELLERLGPERLTSEHQAMVKVLVGRLHEIGGYAYATIYADLNTAFHVGKYSDVLESEWSQVEHWFTVRIEAAHKRRR